jgi:hypothetical protein
MLKFLGALVVLLAIVVGAGFWMQWLTLTTTDGKGNIKIDLSIDTDRMKKDKEKWFD